jgi:hypothetical protein
MTRVAAIMGLGSVAFAVTLAVYVGQHLSAEAVSVLTGAVCGMGAMLPAAIIGLLALARRRENHTVLPAAPMLQPNMSQYPPVIVVTPQGLPGGAPMSAQTWQGLFQAGLGAPPVERQFNVIGEEEGVWNEHRNR